MIDLIKRLKPGTIIQKGPLFSEPVEIQHSIDMGNAVKIIGKGLNTGKFFDPVLNPEQLALISITPEKESFDGDAFKFRLGVEALRLALAYEYDPYFSLSIARIDPLPHQLEAVYNYFLKIPRVRFLLADDPGAGKTIMAGLLIKELKIRGLIKRTLIITPANLSFQWQREMKDKFRENFEIIKGSILRENYGMNPWQERNQAITSISWVSRIPDARESLLRSRWDLIIIDEAHKMSAMSKDKKTLAYVLGEEISSLTDHFLLMTATPHKGDPVNFCLFLELLDKDVYGDVKSLEEAMRRNSAPFYLRRTKEALVTFPDPDTGIVKKLFTNRDVKTTPFEIDDEEWDFYDALTRYVEEQSIKASTDDSPRGRALGFTMAMLQRRFASSIYAVKRSLERMRDKRQKILDDPEAYRKQMIEKKMPDDFDELPDDEQQDILRYLEEVVISIDPKALREEIIQLTRLIQKAEYLLKREIESKLVKLREVLNQNQIFDNPKMKLLIFTEHKDTLDYLVSKLSNEWKLRVTQIHGGMKIGDRDTPGTRIYAEREFREDAQIMVATEAAGEGINLQFCWFMINYDIPWNPVRLEQRMGRIHRYGQEFDCLIVNFVSINTREGRVLQKLLDRLREIRNELGTDQVFDVVGEIFPSNRLEKMLRDMYAKRSTEDFITDRIITEIDADRFREITESTLEGLAKKELNLSAIVGKSAEARERRLVPEVVEDFFLQACPLSGVSVKVVGRDSHIYRIGRVPRDILSIGEKNEPIYGKLGKEYKKIVFDKKLLVKDPTAEWVTPGHPLFEALREDIFEKVRGELQKGAVFFDLHRKAPSRFDLFQASVKDGRDHILNTKIFVVETDLNSNMLIRQPTVFLDLSAAPTGTEVPDDSALPDRNLVERFLIENALNPMRENASGSRQKEIETIYRHIEISLNEIINRENLKLSELLQQQEDGDQTPLLPANIKRYSDRIDELIIRQEKRVSELEQEKHCAITNIIRLGRAWVLPHPERSSPELAPMVKDDEIENIAIQAVIDFEEARGWQVESVESQNRGFDLISRKLHPEDSATSVGVRFIEVKGRSFVGEVALTTNEYKTAERLKEDYWLYVVFNCASEPKIYPVNDPVRLGWKPLVKIDHYHISPEKLKEAGE